MAVRAKARAARRRWREGDRSEDNWRRVRFTWPNTVKHRCDVAEQSHVALLARLTGTAREVAALHAPKRQSWGPGCSGCPPVPIYDGWQAEMADWPCETVRLIRRTAKQSRQESP